MLLLDYHIFLLCITLRTKIGIYSGTKVARKQVLLYCLRLLLLLFQHQCYHLDQREFTYAWNIKNFDRTLVSFRGP